MDARSDTHIRARTMEKEQPKTPYELRLSIYRRNALRGKYAEVAENEENDGCLKMHFGIRNNEIYDLLRADVNSVCRYRNVTGSITASMVARQFPKLRGTLIAVLLSWIDEDRDFIYTSSGLQILKNRYLYENEPIQCAMLRLANIMSGDVLSRYESIAEDFTRERELITLRLFYDLISCGMVQVSSIVAATGQCEDASDINPGEACRLMVANSHYDHRFVMQLEKLCTLISLGVGVGIGVSTVPRYGSVKRGEIRSGLRAVAKKINACNYVSLHERRPKTAMYLHIHNDTFFEIADLKMPSKAPLENIFFGLMIPDYFMECVRDNGMWYFFSGSTTNSEGKTLADYHGDEYRREFKEWVRKHVYTDMRAARDVMYLLLKCLVLTGSPYIIWSDNVNRYNNQAHLGVIKTLNLCAEITNYASTDNSSSCTLVSCNMAMFRDFPDVIARMRRYIRDTCYVDYSCHDFPRAADREIASYAFNIGYVSTIMLNRLLGPKRTRREIGLNPMGVYDMALLSDREDHANVCAVISEALYKGAIWSSCHWAKRNNVRCVNYDNSYFSRGMPQWALRDFNPQSDWRALRILMRYGMANSMLTAQAPTATTCLLTGVTESVTLPMSTLLTKESENGRDMCIAYGEMYRNYQRETFVERTRESRLTDYEEQLAMYVASLPYVDHSQSTMFPVRLNMQEVYNLIVATYKAKLKTGIYYLLFRQCRPTLDIVKNTKGVNENIGGGGGGGSDGNNKRYIFKNVNRGGGGDGDGNGNDDKSIVSSPNEEAEMRCSTYTAGCDSCAL